VAKAKSKPRARKFAALFFGSHEKRTKIKY